MTGWVVIAVVTVVGVLVIARCAVDVRAAHIRLDAARTEERAAGVRLRVAQAQLQIALAQLERLEER